MQPICTGTRTNGWLRSWGYILLLGGLLIAISPGCSGCSDEPGEGGQDSFAEGANPVLIVDPSVLTFSAATVDRPETLAVEIRNVGNGELKGFTYSLNPPLGPFAFADPEITSLGEGQSAFMQITYSPVGDQAITGQLAIKSGGQEQIVQLLTLLPERSLQCEPSPIEFNAADLGQEEPKTVTVRNIGNLPVTLTGYALEVGDQISITATPEGDVELRPEETLEVELTYLPTSGERLQDTLFLRTLDDATTFECPINTTTALPRIDLSPARIDFGAVPAGEKVEEDVVVSNVGESTLKLNLVEISDFLSVEGFAVENPLTEALDIAPGENHTITLSYTAIESGSGVASFESNDPVQSKIGMDLRGRVSRPEIGVDPLAINFGNVGIGVAAPRELSVFNNGTEPLDILSLTIEDDTSGEFVIAADPAFPPTTGGTALIDPAGLERVSLIYTPADLGTDQAVLVISSNDPETSEVRVNLTGSGLDGVECVLAVGPDPLNFGLVARGGIQTLPVTIRNAGTGPCQFNGATAVGIINNAFSSTGATLNQGDQLAPGQSMFIEVQYNPVNTDLNNGRLDINISDPSNNQSTVLCNAGARCAVNPGAFECNNPFEWGFQDSTPPDCGTKLSGLSGISDIAVIPGNVDFGLVTLGCASQNTIVTIYNTGVAPLSVTEVELQGCGNEFELRGVPQLPVEINAGSPLPIQLVYRPSALAEQQCVLRIRSTASSEADLFVNLRGEGTNISRQTDVFEQIDGRKVDVLFVIDGSGSMSAEQDNVASNLSRFVATAELLNNEFHIGVTHLDLQDTKDYNGTRYEAGELMGSPPFLTRNDPNYLAEFQNRVDMGANGGSQEAGLEAARIALSDPLITTEGTSCSSSNDCSEPYTYCNNEGKCGGRNSGFLRDDASLEIVMLSDEEDQSTATPDFYVDFFQSIKGFRNDSLLHVSVIVGADVSTNRPASCGGGSSQSGADAGQRYDVVSSATGGTTGSICASDFGSYLQNIGNRAFGLRREFFLSRVAEPATIEVRVDGADWTTGWTYDGDTNSVIFERANVPEAGTSIEIEYEARCF